MSTDAVIPARPRDARWRTALAQRWPLGFVGAGLVFTGLWMLGLLVGFVGVGLPFDDDALDERAQTVEGVIEEVTRVRNLDLYRVHYRFEVAGRRWPGVCYSNDAKFSVDQRYAVEYLANAPMISRLQGTTKSMTHLWVWLPLAVLILPGFVILALWVRGALRLKILLADGVAVPAAVTHSLVEKRVGPHKLRVDYRYRDADGNELSGSQRLSAGSELARQLQEDHTATVLYDERQPRFSRLVGPEHFPE